MFHTVLDFSRKLGLLLLIAATIISSAHSARADDHRTPGTVYVVLCIDTETRRLLSNYRSQTLDLRDFDPAGSVDSALMPDFRNQYSDSFGGHPVFSWFLLAHEAYFISNPPNPGAIFDAMKRYERKMSQVRDIIGWHYHHSLWPNADSSCCWDQLTTFDSTRYGDMTDVEVADQMLAMILLKERYYPVIFRAGWVWENNDFSRWLDDITPFDYSNAAPLKTRTADSIETYVGAGYDWSHAASDWTHYHPSDTNYQQRGTMKRTIFRCFPGHRGGDISFLPAFSRALSGSNEIVALYTHSFNDLAALCRVTESTLKNAATLYSRVPYRFVDAVTGARAVLGMSDATEPELKTARKRDLFEVTSHEPLFAPPIGAYRDSIGRYHRIYPSANSRYGTVDKTATWRFDLSRAIYTEFTAGACDSAGNSVLTEVFRK